MVKTASSVRHPPSNPDRAYLRSDPRFSDLRKRFFLFSTESPDALALPFRRRDVSRRRGIEPFK